MVATDPTALSGRKLDSVQARINPNREIKAARALLVITKSLTSHDPTFADDQILRGYIGSRNSTILYDPTPEQFRNELITSHFDIVHLASEIDYRTGALSLAGGRLSPEGLSELLSCSETSLLVLASCQSAKLTTQMRPEVAMIACNADEHLMTIEWRNWATTFYGVLANAYTLAKAFSAAQAFVRMQI